MPNAFTGVHKVNFFLVSEIFENFYFQPYIFCAYNVALPSLKYKIKCNESKQLDGMMHLFFALINFLYVLACMRFMAAACKI